MTEVEWYSVDKKPWPFVAVSVRLADGKRALAVWTGHMWWGEGRELIIVAWQPFDGLSGIAA